MKGLRHRELHACFSLTKGLRQRELHVSLSRKAFVRENYMFPSDEGPILAQILDFAFHIGRTPTFFYFNLHLNIHATHYTFKL